MEIFSLLLIEEAHAGLFNHSLERWLTLSSFSFILEAEAKIDWAQRKEPRRRHDGRTNLDPARVESSDPGTPILVAASKGNSPGCHQAARCHPGPGTQCTLYRPM